MTHRDNVADMGRVGREMERAAAARRCAWHLEDRVLVDENRTVVFQ